ncbi:unnamed protein product [Boreogadus saida]
MSFIKHWLTTGRDKEEHFFTKGCKDALEIIISLTHSGRPSIGTSYGPNPHSTSRGAPGDSEGLGRESQGGQHLS